MKSQLHIRLINQVIFKEDTFWLYFRQFSFVTDKFKLDAPAEQKLTKQVNCNISYRYLKAYT